MELRRRSLVRQWQANFAAETTQLRVDALKLRLQFSHEPLEPFDAGLQILSWCFWRTWRPWCWLISFFSHGCFWGTWRLRLLIAYG